MRQSNRAKILEAAVDIVQRAGVTSVTLESVAAEAGLTKGGLMYHFPTRDALLLAVHNHLAQQWETSMIDTAGKSAEEATIEERLVAYAHVATRSATRAELLLTIEASTHPDYIRAWTDVLARWTPPAAEAADNPAALARFVARLAADGLWMYESLTSEPLPAELRQLVAEHIAQAIVSARPAARRR
ncbi:TetR/AcrR family transcriptional regulator [Crossiella sp. NPDC003009]